MRTHAGINARENIQYFTFAGVLAQRDVREIFGDQRKRLRFSACAEWCPEQKRVAPKCTVCDMVIFLFTYS